MHCEHMPMVECVIPFIIGKVQFPVEQPLTGTVWFWVGSARLLMMPPIKGTSYGKLRINQAYSTAWQLKRNPYCGLLAIYGTWTYYRVDGLLGNWTNSKQKDWEKTSNLDKWSRYLLGNFEKKPEHYVGCFVFIKYENLTGVGSGKRRWMDPNEPRLASS